MSQLAFQFNEKSKAYTAAWNSGDPENVAAHFAADGQIEINKGEPSNGTGGIRDMAAGFYAEVPDLNLTCDAIRIGCLHAVFMWTFTGTHSETGNAMDVSGWEEWDLDENLMIVHSRGWFDAEDYARQVAGE